MEHLNPQSQQGLASRTWVLVCFVYLSLVSLVCMHCVRVCTRRHNICVHCTIMQGTCALYMSAHTGRVHCTCQHTRGVCAVHDNTHDMWNGEHAYIHACIHAYIHTCMHACRNRRPAIQWLRHRLRSCFFYVFGSRSGTVFGSRSGTVFGSCSGTVLGVVPGPFSPAVFGHDCDKAAFSVWRFFGIRSLAWLQKWPCCGGGASLRHQADVFRDADSRGFTRKRQREVSPGSVTGKRFREALLTPTCNSQASTVYQCGDVAPRLSGWFSIYQTYHMCYFLPCFCGKLVFRILCASCGCNLDVNIVCLRLCIWVICYFEAS